MTRLCVKDNTYCNSQMSIVTGPNIDISIKPIKSMFRYKYHQDRKSEKNSSYISPNMSTSVTEKASGLISL
jgi:hypothetical protein